MVFKLLYPLIKKHLKLKQTHVSCTDKKKKKTHMPLLQKKKKKLCTHVLVAHNSKLLPSNFKYPHYHWAIIKQLCCYQITSHLQLSTYITLLFLFSFLDVYNSPYTRPSKEFIIYIGHDQ